VCADLETTDRAGPQILTPDQRLRVFISSTLQELAPERDAAQRAVSDLRLTPVLFELGARPHPPQDLYRAYLAQSHVFIGIYWQSYGWIAPEEEISGIEDEYVLSAGMPRLVYVKKPAPEREAKLDGLLDRLRAEGTASYKSFETAEELGELISRDLALLISERFAAAGRPETIHLQSLPAQSTSFVGRSEELAEIDRLFADGTRLVTLTGPGGIGKTRLALEAAVGVRDRFGDGVAFIPLEGLESRELVGPAVVAAVGLREVGPDLAASLVAHLRRRSLLLLLDNFEHVIEAAPLVSDLLEGAPELAILVTSRELLRLRGEHELRVEPLVPESDAAELFAARAAAVLHGRGLQPEDAPLVADICRHLDGVPLAIELTAPRLRLQSPEQLLASLADPSPAAGLRDVPARQQTLEAAIGWSYDLLDADERSLFDRLGLFRASFTVDAAAAVAERQPGEVIGLLASLLDKSLVYRLPGERESRFAMLSMIREFAQVRLRESGEGEQAFDALSAYYVALAPRTEAGLRSVEQRAWKRSLDLEADTLRAVLERLVERGSADDAVRVFRSVWVWFWLSGHLVEGRGWIRRMLPFLDRLELEQRAWLLLLEGLFAFLQLDLQASAKPLAEARALFEQSGDRLGRATVSIATGFAAGAFVGKEAALAELEAGLAVLEELDDAWGTAAAVNSICRIRVIFGDFEGAREIFEYCVAGAERAGDDLLVVLALTDYADYAFAVGEPDVSRRYLERVLELLDATGVRYAGADVLESLARIDELDGNRIRAAELVGTADAIREAMHLPLWGPIAARHARFIDELRAALGAERFEEAHSRGAALSLDHWLKALPGS
jgi:predicted ATPase